MKIGLIGTGNMGTILTEAFIESKAVNPSSITITNRTIEKAFNIKKNHPELEVTKQLSRAVTDKDFIFICVKPLDIYPLLKELSPLLTEQQTIVIITSPIHPEQLQDIVPCQTARLIPSITNRALSGASLLTFGSSCNVATKTALRQLASGISTPIEIHHSITRAASDIVSCGPAFISFLVQKMIEAAVEETDISKEEATTLSEDMLVGLGRLIEKRVYTLPTLQDKVCVKGGVTGEGIKALEAGVQDMFHRLFQNTHEKFDEDLKAVAQQYPTSVFTDDRRN
ncbi:late competence protein ComER [Bacillus stratosphericus]|uniref:late competence protein ComER n=1 Tax=Bacillus stratosphericus TaxID=293386 RepID=UPI001CFB0660|nr:late competence protein ComER [Bacillus stratosphericus]